MNGYSFRMLLFPVFGISEKNLKLSSDKYPLKVFDIVSKVTGNKITAFSFSQKHHSLSEKDKLSSICLTTFEMKLITINNSSWKPQKERSARCLHHLS